MTNAMPHIVDLGHGTPPVCRLGLATRGTSRLTAADVHLAIARGINYLNWCGEPDGLSRAIAELGQRRREVVVGWQLHARDGAGAVRELEHALGELGTDYLDVVTFYYVERDDEWQDIIAAGGAWAALDAARREGTVRMLGLTSHQRSLAARWARSGQLDQLMLRYNAAHRGAETEVFPLVRRLNLPFVAFTCLRWGDLINPTPDDPAGFAPPPAREWYRFVLAHPDVTVALMAPQKRVELDADLLLLDDWRAPDGERYASLRAHGDRVHAHAREFW